MISSIKHKTFRFDSHALPPLALVISNTYILSTIKNTTNKLLTYARSSEGVLTKALEDRRAKVIPMRKEG